MGAVLFLSGFHEKDGGVRDFISGSGSTTAGEAGTGYSSSRMSGGGKLSRRTGRSGELMVKLLEM